MPLLIILWQVRCHYLYFLSLNKPLNPTANLWISSLNSWSKIQSSRVHFISSKSNTLLINKPLRKSFNLMKKKSKKMITMTMALAKILIWTMIVKRRLLKRQRKLILKMNRGRNLQRSSCAQRMEHFWIRNPQLMPGGYTTPPKTQESRVKFLNKKLKSPHLLHQLLTH